MTAGGPFFLALDAGTSAVKAALFDSAGHQLAAAGAEYRLEYPYPDWVELDPEVYWQATQTAIATVLRRSEVDPEAIPAMGVTSQGETLITLDEVGRPLRKAIVWLDNRAREEAGRIAEAFDPEEVYRRTGQQEIVPCWTATKILWLRSHEPHVFAAAARFLMVQDYIVYRLTGRFVSDHALNPSTLYYDLTSGDWWTSMLEFLEVPRSRLPELVFSGTPVASVQGVAGLGAGTSVVTTPIDQISGALGAGNLSSGIITETTGSAMAICATCNGPRYDPQRRIGLYRHALPDSYALLPWVPTAGMLFSWFREHFGGERDFAELEREAWSAPPGSEGLLILPHLNGTFAPEVNPSARGVFYGVTLGHTRGHFIRAIFEAIAFMLRDQMDILESLSVPVEQICSLGGGARSDLWLQIKANVLDRPVVTTEIEEVAALGVAIIAATAAGVYPDFSVAIDEMVRYQRRFFPEPESVGRYAEAFARYRELNRLLVPTFGVDS